MANMIVMNDRALQDVPLPFGRAFVENELSQVQDGPRPHFVDINIGVPRSAGFGCGRWQSGKVGIGCWTKHWNF